MCSICVVVVHYAMYVCIHTVSPDYSIQADATAYFGSVQTNATFGTKVFSFRIFIDLIDFDNDLDFIVLIMVRGNLVERIFKFSDGTNQRTFQIAANGGIDAVNASRVIPEINLIQAMAKSCLLYTSPSPRDATLSRMPSSA